MLKSLPVPAKLTVNILL